MQLYGSLTFGRGFREYFRNLEGVLFNHPCPSTIDPLYPRLFRTAASQPTVDVGSRLATFGRIVGRKTGLVAVVVINPTTGYLP